MFQGNFLLRSKTMRVWVWIALPVVLSAALLWTARLALAQPSGRGTGQASPLHPAIALLDEQGENVLDSGEPISTMKTCGACHDTAFIASHSQHADLGLQAFTSPGGVPGGRAWDTSPGFFGKWSPLTYRYLSPAGDERLDLTTADWIRTFAASVVGGGPAEFSRSGKPLTQLPYDPGDPETNAVDPLTGRLSPWDWQASGVVEMNCFLCHTSGPNQPARVQALEAGNFRWANTASLVGSGVVAEANGEYHYAAEAFTKDGKLDPDLIGIQDPTNANCGQCHGTVHADLAEPFVIAGYTAEAGWAGTTGQVISPQRISDSGMNLANKAALSRTWDVHAERLLQCTDCHFSLNNPVYYQEEASTRPEHLTFDPRRLELGEYLERPVHQFARGASTVEPELANTMRRCDGCHDSGTPHTWLPYPDRHMNALSCETCHIPKVYNPALQQVDWTVIHTDATPATGLRGLEGDAGTLDSLVTGYEPVLIQRQNVDGENKVSPFNLVTAWYWVYGDPERPVPLEDLKAAWLEGDRYHPEILSVFDQDGSGALEEAELRLDSPEKVEKIRARLEQLGLQDPRVAGEVLPYSLNHGVTTDGWAIKACQTCHGEDSRVTQPIELAKYLPGGVMPAVLDESGALPTGELYQSEDGALYYRPSSDADGLYVLGHNRVGWIDLLGSLAFAGVLLGVAMHGSFRFLVSLRKPKHAPQLKRVYMYGVYERLWHWLQTLTILGLLFTGLVIHKPDTFGLFSFRYIVQLHNVLAALLLVNAGLSLFYHLASGEIRQFIPRPAGFFDQAIQQSLYYLRGIFKGEPHPFEKSPQKKLNPLQQTTYFAILNVLLPLQIITGALMWGAQRWPELTSRLGGLPFLAPFHSLIAWLFAAFIVLHVYLTTTGHAPLASIQAMMVGWDELEVHGPMEEATES